MISRLFRHPLAPTSTGIVALLLFFLPFTELRCKEEARDLQVAAWRAEEMPSTIKLTGFDMIQGSSEPSVRGLTFNLPEESLIKSQWLVLAAFVTGLIGVAFTLIKFSEQHLLAVANLTLAGLCLLIERFYFKSSLDPGIRTEHVTVDDLVDIRFTPWFYLSMVLFLLSAVLAYLQGLWQLQKRRYEES